MSLVSIIAMIPSSSALPTASFSPGLRGSLKTINRDHFSNDDLTINSPITFELLSFTEEAQLEETLEAEESVTTQEEVEAEFVEIDDEDQNNHEAYVSIEVLPEVAELNV
jgi:hypothetical protein